MTVKRIPPALLVLGLTTLSTPTLAEESAAPPPPANFFKSGFQVGLSAGYSLGKSDLEAKVNIPGVIEKTEKISAKGNGFSGGGSLGYQYVSPKGLILGGAVELSYDAFAAKGEKTVSALGQTGTVKGEVRRSLAIAPVFVVGMKVAERLLLLGQVGPSIAWLHLNEGDSPKRGEKDDHSERSIGVLLGVKAVYALTQKVYFSFGVDYVRYGKKTKKLEAVPLPNGVVPANQNNSFSYNYSSFTPKLGVTYQF